MARKREIVINQDEDIISYEHNIPGGFVRVLVGTGTTLPNGDFQVAENQNYETHTIQDEEYTDLMSAKGNKPAKTFRKDDLWQYVDSNRAKKNVKP